MPHCYTLHHTSAIPGSSMWGAEAVAAQGIALGLTNNYCASELKSNDFFCPSTVWI